LPSGLHETHSKLAANQLITLREGVGRVATKAGAGHDPVALAGWWSRLSAAALVPRACLRPRRVLSCAARSRASRCGDRSRTPRILSEGTSVPVLRWPDGCYAEQALRRFQSFPKPSPLASAVRRGPLSETVRHAECVLGAVCRNPYVAVVTQVQQLMMLLTARLMRESDTTHRQHDRQSQFVHVLFQNRLRFRKVLLCESGTEA